MLPDRRSDRTLALLFLYNSYIQYCRNFNPIASYCRFIGRSCGSKILIFDAVGSQIRQNISLAVSLQFLYSMLPNY